MSSLLSATALTLTDWAKRLDPDGSVAVIVEALSQTNEILTDMMWIEGNLPTGHRSTVRTGLPSVTWRLLNYGVQPSKSETAQVDDSCGMLEAYSQVDKKLANLQGNLGAFRLSEAKSFLEAMSQEMASKFFYGNTATDPKTPMGMSARYSSTTAGNGGNIIDGGAAGGQTDLMSVWLIAWGENTVHGIFPKGSKAGLQHDDLGEETLIDAAGGLYQGYRDHFSWDAGFTVRDWRYAVRIANIDKSVLIANSSPADLIVLMIRAMDKLPNQSVGNKVFYMNRVCYTMLKIQALGKSSAALSVEHGSSPVPTERPSSSSW